MESPRCNQIRRFLSKALLCVALAPLLPWSCQRRAQIPAAPPPPNSLALGDRYFDAGDYPNAVAAYSEYLRGSPSASNRDRALFRLGLALVFPESPVHDSQQATRSLQELLTQYPQSPFRPQAQLLLQFQEEAERLQSEISFREERIAQLTREVERLEQAELEKMREVERLEQVELAKLRADVSQREERIRQLTQELEKLKEIDMQRRPTPPPR